MTPLTPGPDLDARIALEFLGWTDIGINWRLESEWTDPSGVKYVMPKFSSDENAMGRVLDTLVERGYDPALVYDGKRERWGLSLWWDQHPDEFPDGYWQPTRCLATAAAVLGLMEESDG